MSSTLPKRIHLIGSGRHEEAVAGETIKPGHLIELNSSGNVVTHINAGGYAEKAFALEDALQGNDIDDNYSSGNRVSYVLASPGDVVYAWLAGGEVAVIGSKLASNGDGTLLVVGSSSIDTVLAVALEAVDASDSEGVSNRIKVRII